jgi:hypothetical protein
MNIYIVHVVSKASGQKQTQRQPVDFLACSVATANIISILDEGTSRNTCRALNLISTFLLGVHVK